MARYRIAVDVGGTFTDIFAFDEQTGEMIVEKTPSTPDNPAIGILQAVEKVGVALDEVTVFSHGTTVGTNALITRNLPKTALITTKGFRDVLEIRRGTKLDLWDVYKDVAPPYIRRRDRFEVDERIDAAGRIVKELDDSEVRNLAALLTKRGVQAVAVCLMNSYVNGEHERRIKKILNDEMPGVFVCISSEILPEIFEHERMSTTVVNAVLGPVVGRYLRELTEQLRTKGYNREVLVMHSGGGVMTADTAAQFSARLASSGIAAGGLASAYFAKLCGYQNAIGLDMGGTSTDISLMYQGELRVTKDWYIEYGYPIAFPSIEILTIGAGGGSIAWQDEGGSLRNGPQSAGSKPGPACYRQGGMQPTNTDANVVLGRLGDHLLAGQMRLDREAAREAVASIGIRYGLSVEEAANAILKIANANMCDALRLISVRRGYDPREFALVAFGGAGPLHAADLAREMEIPVVIVPPHPGITSAMGCLLVDVRHDLSKTYIANISDVDEEHLEAEFKEMEVEAEELLRKESVTVEQRELVRYVDMRYVGQWRSLSIRVAGGTDLETILDAFHREHEREYAYSDRTQGVEIYGLRVTAIGKVPKPQLPKYTRSGTMEQAITGERPVYFEESGGFVTTPIYDRNLLPAHGELVGPAVIEQLDSTIVVPPGIQTTVDDYGNLLMFISTAKGANVQ